MNLEEKFYRIIDGMLEHNFVVKEAIDRIDDHLNNIFNKYYQSNHVPYAVLAFPDEVEYQEQLLADTVNGYMNPHSELPDRVNLLRRCSFVIIRGELSDGDTIRFDNRKFSHLFINGTEYTGDYTSHLEGIGAREKITIFAVQLPYDAQLRKWGDLIIDIDDFPIKNAEIYCNVSRITEVQPNITDLLEDDTCESLYVRGNWKWMTSKYCPIRTLSVTGLLMMQSTYNCPNLQNLLVPNTTNIYAKNGGRSSYRNIDISNMTGNINDYAFTECAIRGHQTLNNSGSIGQYAFYNCTGITSLTIGNSVTSIGNSAFERCTGITSLTIGNSVTSIANASFANLTGLIEFSVAEGYHSALIYLSQSNALDWRCFLTVCQNVAAMGENGRTAATIQFKVASIVRTALTNAYNEADETALAIYDLMAQKNISITT